MLNLFYILSTIGVLIGYVIGYLNGFLHLGSILLAFVFISYFYSLKYKRQLVIGNLVVAFLYSMIIFLPVLFELFSLLKVNPDIFKIIILDCVIFTIVLLSTSYFRASESGTAVAAA